MHEGWTCGRDGLRFASLLISFQRFAHSGSDAVEGAPQSLGALPVGQGAHGFLLPLTEAEGFWIGAIISPTAKPLSAILTANRCDGQRVDVARLDGPQTTVIAGMIRPDGRFDVFSRRSLKTLDTTVEGRTARVEPVDPIDYAVATGQPAPEPLDLSAGYGGWRLP